MRNSLSGNITRKSLTSAQEREVLLKTDKRWHICGGEILSTEEWETDHIHTYSMGRAHSAENYLAAHQLCMT